MKRSVLVVALALLLSSFVHMTCPEKIHLLPKYGRQAKCPEQLEADKRFVEAMDSHFNGDRKKAVEDRLWIAWDYYNRGIADTAMMRFNQVWLLDSTNNEVNWGFGNLLGRQRRYTEAISFFKLYISNNPENAIVWGMAGQSYGSMYSKTQQAVYLDSAQTCLRKSYSLDGRNCTTLVNLVVAYLMAMQKDSAVKYLEITDKIDKSIIRPDLRKQISKMK